MDKTDEAIQAEYEKAVEELARLKSENMDESWPIGATVETIVDLGGITSDVHFEGDTLVPAERGIVVPAGSRGKVIDHFEDGRILCEFNGSRVGHSFTSPGSFLRRVERETKKQALTILGDNSVPDEIITFIEDVLKRYEARLVAANGRIELEYANATYWMQNLYGSAEVVTELPRTMDSQRLVTASY